MLFDGFVLEFDFPTVFSRVPTLVDIYALACCCIE